MGNARFAVLYAYTVPGSVSRFTCCSPSRRRDHGHDRGSRTVHGERVQRGRSARAHCTFCPPGCSAGDPPPRPGERISCAEAVGAFRCVLDLAVGPTPRT